MKKDINLLMGVVCALVSCTIAYADGPVKEGNAIVGHVIEKGSEAGLPYATVLLVETGEGTVTDAGGYFRFKKLPAGEYTLKVQIMGLYHSGKEGDGEQRLCGRHAFCYGGRKYHDG